MAPLASALNLEPHPTVGETHTGVWVCQDLRGDPTPQVTNSAKPVCNGRIQAITVDFTMFGIVICPGIRGRDLSGNGQLQAPGECPTGKGVATTSVPPKWCEITLPFTTIHCLKDSPHLLHRLPILNCPLDAFLPLVLIYSFNSFPKQKSFLSANA